jgi:hypothetical protein
MAMRGARGFGGSIAVTFSRIDVSRDLYKLDHQKDN